MSVTGEQWKDVPDAGASSIHPQSLHPEPNLSGHIEGPIPTMDSWESSGRAKKSGEQGAGMGFQPLQQRSPPLLLPWH